MISVATASDSYEQQYKSVGVPLTIGVYLTNKMLTESCRKGLNLALEELIEARSSHQSHPRLCLNLSESVVVPIPC